MTLPRYHDPSRILIVDDDTSIREVVCDILADEGYTVAGATNGATALTLLRIAPAALILLDMNMPVMNGWEFAWAYRQLPGPHAPLVVMTAAGGARERAAQIAAADVLPKPFDIQEVLAVTERYAGPARRR